MDGPANASGGSAAKSAEEVFRVNVQGAVAAWTGKLHAGLLSTAEAHAVRQEAGELRRIAQSRGWGGLALTLQQVETAAPDTASLARAIGALSSVLVAMSSAPGAAPAGPPLTVRIDRSQVNAMVPPAMAPPAMAPPAMAPPPRLDATGHSPPSLGGVAPPPMLDASALAAPPPVAPPGAGPSAPAPISARPARPLPSDEARPAAPKLLVKTMLGFRAFKGTAQAPAKQGASHGSAAPPQAAPTPLLGLSRPPAQPANAEAPPIFRPPSVRPSPSFESPPGARTPVGGSPSKHPWRRSHKPQAVAPDRPGPARRPRRQQDAIPRWFFAVAGAAGLFLVIIVVVVVASHGCNRPPVIVQAPSGSATVTAPTSTMSSAAGPAKAVVPTAPLKESDELRAVLKEQERQIDACKHNPAACNKWSRAAEAPTVPTTLSHLGTEPGWLKRFTLPKDFPQDYPDDDDRALKGLFEEKSKSPGGLRAFRATYFKCGEYRELIADAIAKYEAPGWLRAVAYQESQCTIDAESSVHAKGLWQFMPESARGYGLRVSEDIDERLDPAKATDAAIHFLSDLQQAIGSWDLALAGYNVGPWGVFTRVKQLGGHATYWDLVEAHLLPEETASYVPAIESYALVLENLVSLRLSGLPAKPPWPNAEISDLPEGTSLSLVARAAHTSTQEIKAINRAYLKGVVPKGETTAWVPQSGIELAREFFKNPLPQDGLDACVPEDFNWGASTLPEKYAQGCPRRP